MYYSKDSLSFYQGKATFHTSDSVMKNRSRTDLIASILEITSSGGASKTKIMYGAFLSYMQLKGYLSLLLEKDLIEYQNREQPSSFRTTDKGMHFLQIYNQINELIATIKKNERL
jgi:predicted transcriptional regulator